MALQASDVYSLGVLLWEMYNGQRAWAGLHFAQVSYAMFVEKRSLQFPEGTPEEFRILALSCLSTLPADRPSSRDLPAKLKALIAKHEAAEPGPQLMGSAAQMMQQPAAQQPSEVAHSL